MSTDRQSELRDGDGASSPRPDDETKVNILVQSLAATSPERKGGPTIQHTTIEKVSPAGRTTLKWSKGSTVLKPEVITMGFVERLFTMLENAEEKGFADVIRWEVDGKHFKVHKIKEFEEVVQPMYFSQSKLRYFQRKVSLTNRVGFSASLLRPFAC